MLAICQLLLKPADVPTSDLDMAGTFAILMGGINHQSIWLVDDLASRTLDGCV